MKRTILLFVIFSFVTQLQAQITLDLQPMVPTGWADLNDESTNPIDVKAHATVTNNGSETVTINWELITISHPQAWGVAVCDLNFCYNVGVHAQSFELAAGASSILDVHVYPSGSPSTLDGAQSGFGEFTMNVVDAANADNKLSVSYEVTIDPTVSTTLLPEELLAINVFPNPTTDYFQLEGAESGVERIALYTLLGRELVQFEVAPGKVYDMSAFPKGLYMATILGERNELLKTIRIQKR